jgi:hypothetical protein
MRESRSTTNSGNRVQIPLKPKSSILESARTTFFFANRWEVCDANLTVGRRADLMFTNSGNAFRALVSVTVERVNIQADDIVIRGDAEAGILTGTSAFLTFPCSPMRRNFGQIRAVELPNWIGIALGCHFSSPNHLAECSYMELIRWALSPTLGAIEPYMQVGRTVQFRDGSRKIYSKRFFGRPER